VVRPGLGPVDVPMRTFTPTLAAAIITCSCSIGSHSPALPSVEITELGTSPPGTSAVLLVRASACLACNSGLPRWIELAREVGAQRAPILLVEQPDKADLKALQLARVPVRGVLRRAQRFAKSEHGAVLIVERGKVVRTIDLPSSAALGPVIAEVTAILNETPIR